MNKFVVFSLIFIIIFSFLACSANSTTGLIVVSNTSDVDAKNVKVGNYSIGTVSRGQAVNYYYVTEQTNASISADGFNKPALSLGTIDLKFNYVYGLVFEKQGTTLTFRMTGNKVGGTGLASETISLQ